MEDNKRPAKDMIEVLKMIAADMKTMQQTLMAFPSNGKTVAEYFGNHGAAIAALARIVQSILEQKEEEKNDTYSSL